VEDKYINFIYALVFGYVGGHKGHGSKEKIKKKHMWEFKPGILFFADYFMDIVNKRSSNFRIKETSLKI